MLLLPFSNGYCIITVENGVPGELDGASNWVAEATIQLLLTRTGREDHQLDGKDTNWTARTRTGRRGHELDGRTWTGRDRNWTVRAPIG